MVDPAVMQLISAIKIRPQIYKMKSKAAGNKEILDRLWGEIAFQMQHPEPDCKRKWNILRNCYARSLRQERSQKVVKKTWYLQKELSFLKKYIHPQKSQRKDSRNRNSTEILEKPNFTEESCAINIESSRSPSPVDASNPVRPVEEPVLEFAKTEDEENFKNYFHRISDEEESNCSKISIRSSPIPPEIPPEIPQETPPVVEIRKTETTNEPSNNSNQLFLTSLLPDLNSLSERKQRTFKRKTLELLELLFEEDGYDGTTMGPYQAPPSDQNSVPSALPTVQVTAHHYDPPLVFTVTHKDEDMT